MELQGFDFLTQAQQYSLSVFQVLKKKAELATGKKVAKLIFVANLLWIVTNCISY